MRNSISSLLNTSSGLTLLLFILTATQAGKELDPGDSRVVRYLEEDSYGQKDRGGGGMFSHLSLHPPNG